MPARVGPAAILLLGLGDQFLVGVIKFTPVLALFLEGCLGVVIPRVQVGIFPASGFFCQDQVEGLVFKLGGF